MPSMAVRPLRIAMAPNAVVVPTEPRAPTNQTPVRPTFDVLILDSTTLLAQAFETCLWRMSEKLVVITEARGTGFGKGPGWGSVAHT